MSAKHTPNSTNTLAIDDQALVASSAVLAAEWLGLNQRQLAEIIGVSETTIRRMKNGDTPNQGKTLECCLILIRIYRGLYGILGGDRASIKHWISTVNRHLQNRKPAELMLRVEGLLYVLHYVDSMRAKH